MIFTTFLSVVSRQRYIIPFSAYNSFLRFLQACPIILLNLLRVNSHLLLGFFYSYMTSINNVLIELQYIIKHQQQMK